MNIATDPSEVKKISYNVHGPHGVKVVKVTYFDDTGRNEEVHYHDDKKPGEYKTDPLVDSESPGIAVTVQSELVDVSTMTVSGISREYLLTSHQR